MKESEDVSAWWYVAGGCLLGVALGLLAAPRFGYRLPEEPEGPGLGARALAKIPRRVKVAGVVGGVKGAGSEAAREIRRKVSGEAP